MKLHVTFAIALLGTSCASAGEPSDWPSWGRNAYRNLYSPEKGLPASFDPGKFRKGTEDIDMLPAAPITLASATALVIVSFLTKPPSGETLRKFFPLTQQPKNNNQRSSEQKKSRR